MWLRHVIILIVDTQIFYIDSIQLSSNEIVTLSVINANISSNTHFSVLFIDSVEQKLDNTNS